MPEVLSLLAKYPFLPLYGIAVGFSIWRFPRYFDTVLRLLPIFLMYTLLTELLGVITYEFDEISFFKNDTYRYYNWLIYNIYMLLFSGYFLFVFYRANPVPRARKTAVASMGLLAIISLANPFFQSFMHEMQVGTYLTGGMLLLVHAGLYLKYRARSSGHRFANRDLLSWIALGLILFYLGFIPVTIHRNVLEAPGFIPQGFLRPLINVLIYLFYGWFIIGFWRMQVARRYLKPS